ncbi:hypothetical protein ACHAXN_011752 [Cyclotella atomus]
MANLCNPSPKIAFAIVSFFLGELGDGLNIFQGIYLVSIGWNEGSVGIALSAMGFTALMVQTLAGDVIDKTQFDRRTFLSLASIATAFSALAILFVHEGNTDHALMYVTKVIEGISSSFIAPCVAALTLATFGPDKFDEAMASNILWGHIGSVVSAISAGLVGYILYPNIKYCFLVIGFSATLAVGGVRFLPEGDPLQGRGLESPRNATSGPQSTVECTPDYLPMEIQRTESVVSSYEDVFLDRKTIVVCLTGFFFHFANANVLLVLGELMGGDNEDGSVKRTAIPLIAGAIVLAQCTMTIATYIGDEMTKRNCGRKPLFLAGLITLPIRCALIILWRDKGEAWLLSTQILDGIGGGFFGLLHPYLVADITFGTGRFNVLMGLTASCFGLGATLSNLLGQMAVEKLGHVASLSGSLFISLIPIMIFAIGMPETHGRRGMGYKSNVGEAKPPVADVNFT